MLRRCALFLALAGLVPAAALASGSGHVRVTGDCLHEQYKPRTITITCGDGMTYLSKLHWSRWGPGGASGSGNETIGNGAGVRPIHLNGVFVALSRAERCSHQRHRAFKRVTVTRDGIAKTYQLSCPI